MAGQLPPFSLEIFDHDQTQLAVLNVTNASEQLTYNNIIGALQVCISVVSLLKSLACGVLVTFIVIAIVSATNTGISILT